jgi:hypothetical protein
MKNSLLGITLIVVISYLFFLVDKPVTVEQQTVTAKSILLKSSLFTCEQISDTQFLCTPKVNPK